MKPVIQKNYVLNGLTANLRSKEVATGPDEVEFFFDTEGVLSSSLIDRSHGGATKVEAGSFAEVIESYDRPFW